MSIVRLIVEIIEPFHGRIFDPACGSGGMFVHSAHFVERHRSSPGEELSIYGQEKTGDTVKLAKMNLAVHGLTGEIREGNSYYEDPFESLGRFDFVMANPPFNVDRIDKAKLEGDPRFPELPKADNGNYVWIQLFADRARTSSGRAGFVMANSASDARHSEGEIRRRLIEERLVDVMVAVGPNFFYSVTLPVTLWFLDRGKRETHARRPGPLHRRSRGLSPGRPRPSRVHRRAARVPGEHRASLPRRGAGARARRERALRGAIPRRRLCRRATGLCKVATIEEIEAQGWSLNPGRYVGTEVEELDEEVFEEKLAAAHAELRSLGARAGELEEGVDMVLRNLLSR